MRAGVAAGHPATVEAGIEILDAGGTAADAAVAACLASCVAETVMTGLLGGGHAIYWEAAPTRLVEPRLLRRGAGSGRAAASWSARGPVRRGARALRGRARRRAACPGVPAGSTRSGERTGGCRGRASSSRRCGWPATASLDAARARALPRDARAGDDDRRAGRGSTPRAARCSRRTRARSSRGSCRARARAREGPTSVYEGRSRRRCSRSGLSAAVS